jgi:hypothetical protein
MKILQSVLPFVAFLFVFFLIFPARTLAATITCSPGYTDTFDGSVLDSSMWETYGTSDQNTVTQNGEIDMSTTQASGSAQLNINTQGINDFSGDFDMQVDVPTLTGDDTTHADLYAISDDYSSSIDIHAALESGDAYSVVSMLNDGATTSVSIDDVPVSLRITRQGFDIKTYYKTGTDFILLQDYPDSFGSNFFLGLELDAYNLTGTARSASFDNFSLTCPETAAPTSPPADSSSSDNSSSSSGGSAPSCNDSQPASSPDLFQIDATDSTAKLFFTSLSDTNEYYISYSTDPGAEANGADVTLGSNGGVQNFTVNLLNPGTTYYFKVRGQNGCMPGNWSNIMEMTTNKNGVSIVKSFYKNATPATLPVTGTSWPTFVGFGLGILTILGSVVLAI